METKTLNKTLNLSAGDKADYSEVQAMLQDGWKVKEIHANVEEAGGKNLLYITFTFNK